MLTSRDVERIASAVAAQLGPRMAEFNRVASAPAAQLALVAAEADRLIGEAVLTHLAPRLAELDRIAKILLSRQDLQTPPGAGGSSRAGVSTPAHSALRAGVAPYLPAERGSIADVRDKRRAAELQAQAEWLAKHGASREPDFGDLQDDYRTLRSSGHTVVRLRMVPGYRGPAKFEVDDRTVDAAELRRLAAKVRAERKGA